MKKLIIILIIGCVIFPSNAKAQNDAAAGAALLGGIVAIGAGIAGIEQFKEQLEHKAVEEILTNHNMTNFKIKTSTLDGVSFKDVSSMGVVTYEIDNFDNQEKYILFSFSNSVTFLNSKFIYKANTSVVADKTFLLFSYISNL